MNMKSHTKYEYITKNIRIKINKMTRKIIKHNNMKV